MKKLLITILLITILLIILLPAVGLAATYYVDQSGNGGADGTSYADRAPLLWLTGTNLTLESGAKEPVSMGRH